MRVTLYHVDAFASRPFTGNPAAVCPLERWPDDARLQAIANENNLSETAFLVPEGDGFRLRWFTPTVEVDLCGHATLASAYVLFRHCGYRGDRVVFETRSGRLSVRRAGERLTMDFPALGVTPVAPPEALVRGLGVRPAETYADIDYLVVLADQTAVQRLTPDLAVLATLDRRGVIVTAPGEGVDFVSRFFAPAAGVPEDPVTGSAHCMLTPYWAGRLGRSQLKAQQLSARGGTLDCTLKGGRVELSGQVVDFMTGTIEV
jgi:PhzF family phenazine biosynthesis protein